MKRWVQREFRDKTKEVYRSIKEMTANHQQFTLNQYNMLLGRYMSWGVIDNLNLNMPENQKTSILTYQCVVKNEMRCTDNQFCANNHCNDLAGGEGKKICEYQEEGDSCEQPFECKTHNCEAKNGAMKCKPKKNVEEECIRGYECEHELCIRFRPTYFVQQIKNLIQKFC